MALAKKMPLVTLISVQVSLAILINPSVVYVDQEHYHEEVRWAIQGYFPGDVRHVWPLLSEVYARIF